MVRPMGDHDRFHVMNIDLKASDFPFDREDWDIAFESHRKEGDWNLSVADVNRTPQGFSFNIIEDHRLFLVRIAANPVYPHVLDELLEHEKSIGIGLEKPMLTTIVPEFNLDECRWFADRGFRCERTGPGLFTLYGRKWDGYHFCLRLR